MTAIKTIAGFEFIKAGVFKFSSSPYKFKNWTSELVLDLFDERFEKADETAYLLMEGNEILYVGEFTYNLKDRWLSKSHVNHHMYDHIEVALKSGRTIAIWLAVSPYCTIDGHGELNISKSLEQAILIKHQPKWNSRNKQSAAPKWRNKHCIKLNTFVNEL